MGKHRGAGFRLAAFALVLWGVVHFSVSQTVDVEVENADDIDQLEADGLITEEMALILRDMLENPVDLNRATLAELMVLPGISLTEAQALLASRESQNGFNGWRDVSQLRQLSPAQLRTLRAFAEIRPRVDRLDGRLWVDTSETRNDGDPYYSRARLRSNYTDRLSVGLAVEHEDNETYGWKDSTVEPIHPGWRLDKFYVEWLPGGVWKQVIVGHFTAGFASGLTFNDAHRTAAKGIYTDDTTSSSRQRGVTASWEKNRWQGTVFASTLEYPVTLPGDVTGLPTQRSIARVYAERLVGASASYRLNRQTHIGGVVYHSWIQKHVDTEFRNLPNRERWAALGLHANTQVNLLNLRAELTRTFEAGWAGYLESALRTRSLSLLASLRHYSADFDNPHSHGFADSDDATIGNVDGDIDEVGVFLEARYQPHQRVRLRVYYDQWRHPSRLETDNEAYAELRTRLVERVEVGLSGKWQDNIVGVEGDERRSGLLWLKVDVLNGLRLTPVYRRSAHRTLSGTTDDDYVYVKVEWLVTQQLEWEARFKINDTAAIAGDSFPKEFYAQVQVWDLDRISGRVRYTRSQFGSDSTAKPNPRHSVFARMEYEW